MDVVWRGLAYDRPWLLYWGMWIWAWGHWRGSRSRTCTCVWLLSYSYSTQYIIDVSQPHVCVIVHRDCCLHSWCLWPLRIYSSLCLWCSLSGYSVIWVKVIKEPKEHAGDPRSNSLSLTRWVTSFSSGPLGALVALSVVKSSTCLILHSIAIRLRVRYYLWKHFLKSKHKHQDIFPLIYLSSMFSVSHILS